MMSLKICQRHNNGEDFLLLAQLLPLWIYCVAVFVAPKITLFGHELEPKKSSNTR